MSRAATDLHLFDEEDLQEVVTFEAEDLEESTFGGEVT